MIHQTISLANPCYQVANVFSVVNSLHKLNKIQISSGLLMQISSVMISIQTCQDRIKNYGIGS